MVEQGRYYYSPTRSRSDEKICLSLLTVDNFLLASHGAWRHGTYPVNDSRPIAIMVFNSILSGMFFKINVFYFSVGLAFALDITGKVSWTNICPSQFLVQKFKSPSMILKFM